MDPTDALYASPINNLSHTFLLMCLCSSGNEDSSGKAYSEVILEQTQTIGLS